MQEWCRSSALLSKTTEIRPCFIVRVASPCSVCVAFEIEHSSLPVSCRGLETGSMAQWCSLQLLVLAGRRRSCAAYRHVSLCILNQMLYLNSYFYSRAYIAACFNGMVPSWWGNTQGCCLRSSVMLFKLSLCTLRAVLVIKLAVSLAFKDSYTDSYRVAVMREDVFLLPAANERPGGC